MILCNTTTDHATTDRATNTTATTGHPNIGHATIEHTATTTVDRDQAKIKQCSRLATVTTTTIC